MADYLQIATMVRNEGRNLAEWIAFHEVVGVQGFLIYDNGSTDDTREVLAGVRSATVLDWPGERRQFDAYADAVARADTRWLAFIDPDEYLFSPHYLPLPAVLRAYEQHDAVAVCQLVFGTSDVARPQPSTIRTYERRAPPGDPHVKSILQLTRVRPGARSPHHFDCVTVDEHHRPVAGPTVPKPTFEHLRINHYYTRSIEEAQEKARRPIFDVPADGSPPTLRRGTGLLRPELNAELDDTILAYADLVEARLRAITALEPWGGLDEDEAALLERCTRSALAAGPGVPVVEIGSHGGRSTVVLATVAESLGSGARLYAIEPQPRWPLPSAGDHAGLAGVVTPIMARAHEVTWRGPIGLLVIDGRHDHDSARRNFEHFEHSIVPQGIAVFHNSGADGVTRFVKELCERGWQVVDRAGAAVALRRVG
jgi:predicted O-methyltransferase YrrM